MSLVLVQSNGIASLACHVMHVAGDWVDEWTKWKLNKRLIDTMVE